MSVLKPPLTLTVIWPAEIVILHLWPLNAPLVWWLLINETSESLVFLLQRRPLLQISSNAACCSTSHFLFRMNTHCISAPKLSNMSCGKAHVILFHVTQTLQAVYLHALQKKERRHVEKCGNVHLYRWQAVWLLTVTTWADSWNRTHFHITRRCLVFSSAFKRHLCSL